MSDSILDSILDATLDDLADLPSIKAFPAGVHVCDMSLEAKVVNKKPTVFVNLKVLETLEMSDPSAIAPKTNDETSIMFMLKNNDGTSNEINQGLLKNILTKLKSNGVSGDSNREIIAATRNGVRVTAVTGQRLNSQSGDQQTTLIKFEVAY